MEPENNERPPLAQPLPVPSAAEPGAVTKLKFRERFETLLPTIQREWPDVARHTLEATRGSLDHLVDEISRQTGAASSGVKDQLVDLLHTTTDQAHQVADSLRPLEDQLEGLKIAGLSSLAAQRAFAVVARICVPKLTLGPLGRPQQVRTRTNHGDDRNVGKLDLVSELVVARAK